MLFGWTRFLHLRCSFAVGEIACSSSLPALDGIRHWNEPCLLALGLRPPSLRRSFLKTYLFRRDTKRCCFPAAAALPSFVKGGFADSGIHALALESSAMLCCALLPYSVVVVPRCLALVCPHGRKANSCVCRSFALAAALARGFRLPHTVCLFIRSGVGGVPFGVL